MKVRDHVDQYLLTYKSPYPIGRLIKKYGPQFESQVWNRAGNTFKAQEVDILRSYKGDDVFTPSDKGKMYVIPSAASITPVVWPDPNGPSKDVRLDVAVEYDAIRNIANQGSKLVAPGLIDEDLSITSTRKYKVNRGYDPVTGEKWPKGTSAFNDWSQAEIPLQDQKNLPARTFVAYSIPDAKDINGNPEPRTMLVYTGETKGVQYDDGVILLYGFLPSAEHPLTILAGA